jgi:hypothetical protein
MVIDHLHDDRPALYNCSLICRSWLHSSRIHKFTTIEYGHISPNITHRKSFSDCLVASDFIRSLIAHHYLPHQISLCTNLIKLEVADVIFNSLEMQYFYLPSLAALIMNRCRFQNAPLFTRFLQSFPCLTSLEISDLSCPSACMEEVQTSYEGFCPSFTSESIIVDRKGTRATLSTLSSSMGDIQFTSIHPNSDPFIGGDSFTSVGALNAGLKFYGSHLVQLNLQSFCIRMSIYIYIPLIYSKLSHD